MKKRTLTVGLRAPPEDADPDDRVRVDAGESGGSDGLSRGGASLPSRATALTGSVGERVSNLEKEEGGDSTSALPCLL